MIRTGAGWVLLGDYTDGLVVSPTRLICLITARFVSHVIRYLCKLPLLSRMKLFIATACTLNGILRLGHASQHTRYSESSYTQQLYERVYLQSLCKATALHFCFLYSDKLVMGIDLATWRARIGLNYYHMCGPLQTRWRSSGGWLYQPGVASWGVGEIMNNTSLVLKGCMTVVALSLILQYVVYSWSKLKGGGGGGKVHCHRQGSTCRVKGIFDGGETLLLRAIVVVVPLLLIIAGDVETNPGPPEREGKVTECLFTLL